ncbi:uncharacterized protein LOC133909239 [Phragmites australis]|uniref:uncharacterized protein LOC133909239 n=1 Tax=Phragmites australis TaxID=29695 RepID=UPI002D785C38|nr:uncharacterized protein LOC133909239 [Phragmites australis]XP_062207560.1 uncharacterized protein LOC133909239 [Phragmites australis]
MGGAGMALAVAFTAALAVLFFVLLAVLLYRHWWRRREAEASTRGFVLFDVCFHEDRLRRAVRPSMDRNRRRAPREQSSGEVADDQEPDQYELARWKKMFGGPTRSLSTIDEVTEKDMTPIATPAFCTPPASPDRRDARALDMASIAVQV